MVLWKYEQGSEVCYYDDEEQDCTWNLPTDLDYEPEPVDLTNALTKKKVERAFQRVRCHCLHPDACVLLIRKVLLPFLPWLTNFRVSTHNSVNLQAGDRPPCRLGEL